jgi:hypothetical protein
MLCKLIGEIIIGFPVTISKLVRPMLNQKMNPLETILYHQNLHKRYGSIQALKNVSFDIQRQCLRNSNQTAAENQQH